MTLAQALIGESPAMVAIVRELDRVLPRLAAGRRVPVLLLQGETGTGKGLVARSIHRASPRQGGPFVDVNCSAIPTTLLEAELFGFERGAFTDARQPKPGLVQAADGGTLFLDEIALLPADLQGKLLTVLEERQVRRLGSTRSVPIDVLFIAASNVDLAAATSAGRFREDLYHRLTVLTFTLPPLRERGGDVLRLANEFLDRACADYRIPRKTLTDDALAALQAYGWPGNVRELSNMMERAALLVPGTTIAARDLGLPAPAVEPYTPGQGTGPSLRDAVRSFERAQLESALRAAGGRVAIAARRLGIPRSTLRYHLERYGLDPGREAPRAVGSPSRAPADPEPIAVRWEQRHAAILRAVIRRESSVAPVLAATSALEALVQKVHSFGGRLEELASGGLLAVFGLDPLDDAPIRAAQAAAAMIKEIERTADGLEPTAGLAVALHVDQFLVTRIEGTPHVDPEAKRQVADLLDAMLAHAEPGTVVATGSAARFLRRRYQLEAIATPAHTSGEAYRVAALEPGVGPRMLTPFVGRQRELALLHELLVRAQDRGQAVAIVGEAGMGKSRLLHEFRAELDTGRVAYLETRGEPFASDVPHVATAGLLRQVAGIAEGDTAAAAAAKLEARMQRLGIETGPYLAPLLRLLGAAGSDADAAFRPGAAPGQDFESLRRILRHTAREQPLVVAVEDAHWIDRTSAAAFRSLVSGLTSAPILFAVTTRPGGPSLWGDDVHSTTLTLEALPRPESLALVHSLIDPAAADVESIVQQILARADGNPLFLEELVRDASERDPRPSVHPLPATIQQVVLTRLDRLPDDLREVLATGAVLGASFTARDIAAVAMADTGVVQRALADLVRLDFLREAMDTAAGFTFKHALVRETAYENLPLVRRQALHLRAGEALETWAAGRPEALADQLAYHYGRSGDVGKAVQYLVAHAGQAARRYARTEAVQALHQALAQVESLAPGREHDQRFAELVLRQRDVLPDLGDLRRGVLEFLLRERDHAERLDDASIRGIYHLWLSRVSAPLGEYDLAIASARRAIVDAERTGDVVTKAAAQTVIANACMWVGRATEGLACARQAVQVLEGADQHYWLGYAYRGLALGNLATGDFSAARTAAARLGAIGTRHGEPFFRFSAAWIPAVALILEGALDDALAACQEVLETAPSPVEIAQASIFLAMVHLESERADPAIALLTSLVQQSERLRQRHIQGTCTAYLAEAHFLRGDVDRARQLVSQALPVLEETGYAWGIGHARRLSGRIARSRGERDTAAAEYGKALEVFRAIPAPYEVARTRLLEGDAAAADGERTLASARWREALEIFDRLGVRRWADRARAALADAEEP